MEKIDIDQKYIDQANQLEAEYFDFLHDEKEVLRTFSIIVGYQKVTNGEDVYEPILETRTLRQIEKTNYRRQIKEGKSYDEFNQRHAEIWRGHEAELIAEGFLKERVPPEPRRDLAKEVDEIKGRLTQLEKM